MRFSLLGIAIVLLSAATASAQSGPNVTLQLPSFHSTGVDTTVLVPDSGTAPLASQRQAFYGRSLYGPRRQRTAGTSLVAGGMQVRAQIHDARAAEASLLRDVRERRANWQRGSLAGRAAAPDPNDPQALVSVAEIQRRHKQADTARKQEAERLLSEARRARDEHKPSVALLYYEMAARRAGAPLRAVIAAEAAKLEGVR